MKRILVFVFAVALLGSCTESVTLIPDENFEKALIANGIDDTLDGGVLTSNINGIKGLDIGRSGISNLTGIEDFTDLEILKCYENQLTNLDLSKNTALTRLDCGGNKLTSLDISINTALTDLECYKNQLTNLDVSKNTALRELSCSWNRLTNLDVSGCTSLTELNCYENHLTNLDISNNTALTQLNCGVNRFNCEALKAKYGL